MAETINIQELVMRDVVHVTVPHDYFGTQISDKPIFGTNDAKKLGFEPLPAPGLEKPIIYMPAAMQKDPQANMLKTYLTRDKWEYLRYAQLDMAGKFEDTLAYREKNGITTDRTLLLGLQYFMLGMLRYSNFNFLIDFNELNRISLKPTSEALKDLYILNAAATQNLNWAIIKNTNLNKTCPTLGRDLLFEALKLRNPPEYTPQIGNSYLHRYVYLRDKVLSNQSCTPWSYEPYQTDLTADSIKAEFKTMKNSCNQPTQQK